MSLLTLLRRRRSGTTTPTASGASFADINTTLSSNLGPDGMTWAQAWPVCVDEFGKMVLACQVNGGGIQYMYSNNDGLTWADNTGITGNGSIGSIENFITRCAMTYDPVNDHFWSLHVSTDGGSGGAFLRRYTATRDGSNNITTIVRDQSASCVLEDDGSTNCRQPILLRVLQGAAYRLIALWEISDSDTVEMHGCVRTLSGTADDLTSTNWLKLDGGTGDETSTIASTKSANVSVLTPSYGFQFAPAACIIRNGTNAGDLAIFWQVATTDGTVGKLRYRRYNRNGNNWDSPTTPLDIIANVRAGSTTIRQLYEVLSKPVEDASGNLYITSANWKSNTDGDTWTLSKVTTADALGGTVDVYSCSGAFSPALYALTGDVAYDATSGLVCVAHITTGGVGNNDGVLALYNTTLVKQGSSYTFFTAQDVDIPLIYQNHDDGDTRVQGGKLLFLFRDTRNQAAPYHGWAGTVALN